MQFANSHYILTAAHVWEPLKSSQRVGITLKENIDQRCPIDTNALVPFSLPTPKSWNEWGPDLVFLRVPSNRVGGIEAFMRFYSLDRDQPKEKGDGIEALFLMEAIEKYSEESGVSRFGEPEEIADLLAYLVSPAAKWMTGVSLRTDGGEFKGI